MIKKDAYPLGERRSSNRFPISQEVRYRVFERRGQQRTGVGRTLDMSSSGIRFTTDQPLNTGKRLEVSISWPAQLNNACGLKLVASGKVVRTGADSAAMQIEKYEFKTRSTGYAASVCAEH